MNRKATLLSLLINGAVTYLLFVSLLAQVAGTQQRAQDGLLIVVTFFALGMFIAGAVKQASALWDARHR